MAQVVRIQHTSVPMPPGAARQAREFYANVMAMPEISPPTSLDHQELIWFSAGDGGAEVHVFADESLSAKSAGQHLCLQVDNVAEYRARFSEAGIPIEETTAIPNRPRFFVRDPFGNLIEIAQIDGDYD